LRQDAEYPPVASALETCRRTLRTSWLLERRQPVPEGFHICVRLAKSR